MDDLDTGMLLSDASCYASSSSTSTFDGGRLWERSPSPPIRFKEKGTTELLELPQELLYHICTMLDIPEVLRLSKTCKSFFQTCSLRSLWLNILDELDFYETPNLPSHLPLTSYSTAELKRRAINAVLISKQARGTAPMKFTRLDTLHTSVRFKRSFSIFRKVDPFLLPGGQRMLVNNYGQLELWSIGSDDRDHRCIWRTDSSTDEMDVVAFNGEVVDGGSAVMIACVFVDRRHTPPMLRVFRFDESTQTCSVVCETRMSVYVSHVLMIRGNYVLLYQLQSFELWVLDWTSGRNQYVDFKDQKNQTFRIRSALLVENALVVTGDTGKFFGEGTLQVFAVQPQHLASSSTQAVGKINRTTVQVKHTEELEETKDTWGLAINAFQPFWRRNANAPIELCVVALKVLDARNLLMRSYRLQVHTPEADTLFASSTIESLKLQVKDVSCAKSVDYPVAGALSNAALIFTLQPKFKCFAAFCDSVQPSPIDLRGDESIGAITRTSNYSVSIEPWSNAISVGSEGMVAILRFD
ncbi:hypothetical protein SCHPADRAFT_883216 [Schizopora paradoxa]|uniref:F-box domain-containing protein n=1 Tax=Schizopora paradoxa TaxID=27342 RepID=A0A0H2R3S3_9AGAM|nr:hypothetical protein SCHPADRAFT_883216 [Schizopora paradoxa]